MSDTKLICYYRDHKAEGKHDRYSLGLPLHDRGLQIYALEGIREGRPAKNHVFVTDEFVDAVFNFTFAMKMYFERLASHD